MTERTKPPPLLGKLNRQWLATAFGSTDGTLRGIKDRFDRKRCEARIRFQERFVAQWRRGICIDHGSADGSCGKIPQANYEAAMLQIHHTFEDVQTQCRDGLKRPALLRERKAELLDPFFGDDDNEN